MELRYIKNTTTCGTTLIELLLNAGIPQTSKRARKPLCNWAWQKKEEEQKENGLWVACASGRELWKRKGFCTRGSPLTSRDRELQSLGGQGSSRCSERKTETDLPTGSVPTGTPQLRQLSTPPWGR